MDLLKLWKSPNRTMSLQVRSQEVTVAWEDKGKSMFLEAMQQQQQICLGFAIDCTSSNGSVDKTESLHYQGPNIKMDPKIMNGYEQAIQLIGNLLGMLWFYSVFFFPCRCFFSYFGIFETKGEYDDNRSFPMHGFVCFLFFPFFFHFV